MKVGEKTKIPKSYMGTWLEHPITQALMYHLVIDRDNTYSRLEKIKIDDCAFALGEIRGHNNLLKKLTELEELYKKDAYEYMLFSDVIEWFKD